MNLKNEETSTQNERILFSYISSIDKNSTNDTTLYRIVMTSEDLEIDCIGNSNSIEMLFPVHLRRSKNILKETCTGTLYTLNQDEPVLVIETIKEIILLFYDKIDYPAKKVIVFKKCEI